MAAFIPPQHVFDLNNVNDYTSILGYFSKHNIKYYVYTFAWKHDIMKYGISYKNGARSSPGDRVYTQAGYLPGWEKPCLTRGPKSKIAMNELIKELENMYNDKLIKDDVVLTIDDYTNCPFSNPLNIYPEMQNIEERMKADYFNKHGRYPLGNKKQEGIRPVSVWSEDLWDFGA